MRHSIAFLLALAIAGCGASAPAPATTLPAAVVPADLETAIGGALEQYRQTYKLRSVDAMESVYAATLDVVIIEQGTAHRGYTAVEKHLSKLLGSASSVHLVMRDVAILPLGKTGAVVTAKLEREIGDGVTTIKVHGLLTLVFESVPSDAGERRWLIVHEHFSHPTG